jgi:hypothetical protein
MHATTHLQQFTAETTDFTHAIRPDAPASETQKRQVSHETDTALPICRTASVGLLILGLFSTAAFAELQRDDKSLAWVSGTNVFWRFSFDPPGANRSFTRWPRREHAADQLQARGPSMALRALVLLKYIRHDDGWRVNYWEENSAGNAQGKTRWDPPTIETQTDGRATIRLKLSYLNPSGETDMTELRELQVSAPAADGGFSIDWLARFTAGDKDLVLDRTPMPGEPGGAVNGGYAGLSARMVPLPVTMSVVTTAGPVERFVSNRARPNAAAVACNFTDGSRDVGGLAFFSDPANTGGDAPWYIIDSQQMPFICQALLAPKPRSVRRTANSPCVTESV